jgi:hypothetical protein
LGRERSSDTAARISNQFRPQMDADTARRFNDCWNALEPEADLAEVELRTEARPVALQIADAFGAA